MRQQSLASSESLRILIVAHAFPPMNSTASHRPYSWARVWCNLGHDIHVLTPAKHAFDGTLDLPRDLSGIHVHEVGYLPFFQKALAMPSPGLSVGVVRWERLKTLTRRMRFILGMFGDPRLLAYLPLVRKGRALMRSLNFDFIIASSPPEVTLFAARKLSRDTGVPWVADFRDLWFYEMRLYHSRAAARLAGPVNRWLTKSAAALVTVSGGLRQRLTAYLHRPVFLSYNGYFEQERNAGSAHDHNSDGRIHIVYTGRVYPDRQNPAPLFHAIQTMRQSVPDVAARLVVDFYGFEEPWLRELIAKFSVGDFVRMHGFVPYRQSIAAQRAADILLLLDWTDRRAEGVVTGKLFEYLASGRPILAIGTRKDSEAARIITDAGCGLALTRVDEIAAWLAQLLKSPRPAPAESRSIDVYSRERQAQFLLKELSAQGLNARNPVAGLSVSK